MTTIKRRKLGVTLHDQEQCAGAFALYAPLQTGNGRVLLINMNGDIEHEWNLPVRLRKRCSITIHVNFRLQW